MTNYLVRGALPSLVPLIAELHGWTDGQIAWMMALFSGGYLSMQLPAGAAAQRFGARNILSLNMLGNALCLFLAPRLVMRGLDGHWPLGACFFMIGLCQGPLMPCKAALQAAWLPAPPSVERVWATRFTSLGGRLAHTIGVAVTPRISSELGWRYVCYIYGSLTAVFCVAWHLVVTDAPKAAKKDGGQLSGAPGPSRRGNVARPEQPQPRAGNSVDWRIFRVRRSRPGAALRDTERVCTAGQMRSVQSIIASKVALKNSEDCLQYWGFMYFRDIFSLDQVTVGKMFSVPLALSSVLGNVITGVAESILLKRGMDLLRIRKSMSWIGNTMQAGAVLLFALAPTPFLALVGYFFQRLGALTPAPNHTRSSHVELLITDSAFGVWLAGACFHGSGCNASDLDVGGKRDSAVLMAVGNMAGTVPGVVTGHLKLLIVRMTGGPGWVPLFALASALHLLAGGLYGCCASVTPAREELERRCQQKAAAKRKTE